MPKQQTQPDLHLCSLTEVSRLLGIPRQTVWKLVRAGTLPSIRLGRLHYISRAALLSLTGVEVQP